MNDMIQNDSELMPATTNYTGAVAGVEQSRAVAEVQACLVLARSNPRNEVLAEKKILNACKRQGLAEGASYSFRRGSEVVTGPSIRLAEVLARYWGNINYGFREIGRGSDYSEIEAFCHDFETNVKVSRTFQIKHWRDKKGGGAALTAERDKYEHVASHAQRRVRACLLEIIPGDIVEMAEEACKATLVQSIGNIDDKIKQILEGFAKLNVTQAQIEAYMQRPIRSIVPADVVMLQRIFRSIRDGIASVAEFFEEGKENAAQKIADKFAAKTAVQEEKSEDQSAKTAAVPPVEKTKPAASKKPPVEKKADLPTDKPVDEAKTEPAETEDAYAYPPQIKAEMEEVDKKKSGQELDVWSMKHIQRIETKYGKEWADYMLQYVLKRRNLLNAPSDPAAPSVEPDSEEPMLVNCPQGKKGMTEADCDEMDCRPICTFFNPTDSGRKMEVEI